MIKKLHVFFIKKTIMKYILLFFHILFYLSIGSLFNISNAQNKNSFDIEEVNSKNIYTNILQFKGALYIGSNNGAIEINTNNNEPIIHKDIVGYITINKEKIIGGKLTEDSKPSDNEYNNLLPDKFKRSSSRTAFFNNKLYIINNNVLFVFKRNFFLKNYDSLNIRCVTKNLIGSYNGIFNHGKKLEFPSYTDGKIREYEDEYFICYGGLYRDSSGNINNYYNEANGETKIGKNNIGHARDIIKLHGSEYALTTNKGIYIINLLKKNIFKIISSNTKNEYFLTFKLNDESKINSFYFTENSKIYFFENKIKEKYLVFDTKKNDLIKDVYMENSSNFYVLFESQLVKYTKNYITNIFEDAVLMNDLKFTHNIINYKNTLVVTTNNGTHFYNIKTNKSYYNAIPYEANRRSLCIINDTLKYATTSGLINISENDLNNIFNEIDKEPYKSYKIDSEIKNYIITFLFALIFILSITLFVLYKKSKVQSEDIKKNKVELTKEIIETYIQENITSVTVQNICQKFKLTKTQLYEIIENEKPGETIRKYRINLVRKYRRLKKDEKFIADNTGFSISYLKKI